MKNGTVLRFGDVTVDPSRRLLLRGSRPVHLESRAYRLLAEGPNVVGREPPAGVVMAHPSVSREHARIDVEGDRAAVEDLGSKNGAWRGEGRLAGRVALSNGNGLRFGAVHVTYRGPSVAGPGDTETCT